MCERFRSLIVDDEAPARNLLQSLLKAHSDVEVVGEANSASTAVSLFYDLHPNLIFLDVQMPKGDGFSILQKLDPLPAIIFVTGYDKFAARAFEVNAVDYLLKPISADRLYQAIERVRHIPQSMGTLPLSEHDRIILRSDTRGHVTFVSDISCIESEQNYSRVHVGDGNSLLTSRGITEWEVLLPKACFLRIHRSFIVNLKAVKKVNLLSTEKMFIDLNGMAAPISLNRKASTRLRDALRELKTL